MNTPRTDDLCLFAEATMYSHEKTLNSHRQLERELIAEQEKVRVLLEALENLALYCEDDYDIQEVGGYPLRDLVNAAHIVLKQAKGE